MSGDSYIEDLKNIESIDQTAQRVLITLVIDCSQSMMPHFSDLQQKFDDFIDKSKKDIDVSRCADICVVTYGNEVTVPVRPMSILNVDSVKFNNMGQTNTPKALEIAINEARQWANTIENNGMRVWKPWIVLMTDGYTTYSDLGPQYSSCCSREDMERVLELSNTREIEGKHHVLSLGMGTDFDADELSRIAKVSMAITDWNFQDFFTWLFKSMKTMSSRGIVIGPDGIPRENGKEVHPADTGEEVQRMIQNLFTMRG